METALGAVDGIRSAANSGFVTVTIADTGESYRCRTDESLLEGMRRMGKRGIPVGCRGGGCSVCKIQVVSGAFRQFRPMSREYVSDEDLAADRILACCIQPLSAIELSVVGKLRKKVCAISSGQSTTSGAVRPNSEEK